MCGFLNPECITIPARDATAILEVKWDAFLPDVIRDAVQIPAAGQRHFLNMPFAACMIEKGTVFMTTFSDIFKSSFMENLSSVSIPDALIALALAFALGLFIFLIYKKLMLELCILQDLGVTLLALTMITTLVILAVTSNVVLSLGMVGALSIVRFPYGHQRAFGHCFSLLVHCSWHCLGGRDDSSGRPGSGVMGLFFWPLPTANPMCAPISPYFSVTARQANTGR